MIHAVVRRLISWGCPATCPRLLELNGQLRKWGGRANKHQQAIADALTLICRVQRLPIARETIEDEVQKLTSPPLD